MGLGNALDYPLRTTKATFSCLVVKAKLAKKQQDKVRHVLLKVFILENDHINVSIPEEEKIEK